MSVAAKKADWGGLVSTIVHFQTMDIQYIHVSQDDHIFQDGLKPPICQCVFSGERSYTVFEENHLITLCI